VESYTTLVWAPADRAPLFGLQLENGERVEQVKRHKVKSDMGEQSGSFHVSQRGAVEFVFDNRHSLLNSKTVHFKLKALGEVDLKHPDQSSAADMS
jgi:hypothetical protein